MEKKKQKMLLVIDPQYSFLDGGELGVNGSMEIMDKLCEHIKSNDYDIVIFTCDWHPHNHVSFKEWGKHCVQFTHGASIYDQLYKCVEEKVNNFKVLTKGNLINKEEYSIMDNYESSKILLRYIEMLNVSQIDICGCVSEICVLNSIKGLVNAKQTPKLKVLLDYTVKLETHEPLIEFCKKNAVRHG